MARLLLAAFLSTATPGTDDELARAEKLLAQRQFAAAESVLRAIVGVDPGNARAHGNLALALLPQGKLREAVDEARLAAAMGPDLPEARYIYGLALRADGRPHEAARELERAVAAKPGQAGPLRVLAGTYADGEDPRTVATYEKLIALEPGRSGPRAELAEYLWRVGRDEEGNRVIERAIRDLPKEGDLALRFGRALFAQERYLDAAARLEEALRLPSGTPHPESAAALLGEAYAKGGRPDRALAALEAAQRRWPEDSRLRQSLGDLLLSLGRSAEALPHLEAVAASPSAPAEARLNLGRAYESLGRLAEAEAAYRGAAKLSPNSPRAHYALGRLLLRRGDRVEGEKELAVHRSLYEQAQKRVSESQAHRAEAALAWSELGQGKTAEALARFSGLPETADTLLGRATVLSRLKRHPEAVAALERARQLEPENARVQALLAAERSRNEEKR